MRGVGWGSVSWSGGMRPVKVGSCGEADPLFTHTHSRHVLVGP